jgi:hypothetical protein
MKTVTINNFSGGIADPRESSSTLASLVRHFIIGRTKLTPFRALETEALDTGTLANQRLTDAIRYNYTGSTKQIFALGQASTSNPYPKFYQKSTTNDPTATFQAIANGEDTSGTVIPGSLIGYKGALYCLKTKSGSTYLVKHVYATSVAEIGAIGLSPSNGVVPQMFIHPKDNRLYMASGYTMGSYDGSTLTTRDFSTAHDITSITYTGNNIAIGMVSKDTNSSVVGIWNGSLVSSELVDVVDWGGDTLLVLENINDVVVGVSGLSVGGSSDVGTQNAITIRGYTGGTAQILKTVESIGSLGSRVYPLKAKRNGVLFFPMSAYLNGTRVNQIWAFFKNEQGFWVITPDIKPNGDTELSTESIIGLSVIGDYKWVAFSSSSSTGSFFRTDDSATFTTTSTYETLANPNMEVGDKSKSKKLKAVSIKCGSPSGSSHTVTLSYSVNGGAYTTIYTGSSSDEVRVVEASAESDGKPFNDAREYMFKIETTGNGEVYELKYAYEVIPTLI